MEIRRLAMSCLAMLLMTPAASAFAQEVEIEAVLVAAVRSEMRHWPSDRAMVIDSGSANGVERAVARSLNARVKPFRGSIVCEGEPRRCRPFDDEIIVNFRNLTIDGNSATVDIQSLHAAPMPAGPMHEHRHASIFVSVRLKLQKAGSTWRVVDRTVRAVS